MARGPVLQFLRKPPMLDNPNRNRGFLRPIKVSGTALAVGVFPTQRHCSLTLAICLGIGSLLFSAGCDVSNVTPSVGKNEVDAAALEIDAGVIFCDRSSYLCIPLSRFGLSRSKNIESMVSSCECVKPSLVRYANTSTVTADGVLLEFIPDKTISNTPPQSMRLTVEVVVTMSGADIRTFKVSFLHTHRLVYLFDR